MSTTVTKAGLGSRIDIPSAPNLRDLGGYPVPGSRRVRTGQLYRSAELNHLHGGDLEAFAGLGIRTVFDLRTAAERSAEPDVLPKGTELVVCDVLEDSQSAAPAALMKVLSDPPLAEEMLGEGKAASRARLRHTGRSSRTSQRTLTGPLCSTARPGRTARAGPQRRCSCSACRETMSSTTTS